MKILIQVLFVIGCINIATAQSLTESKRQLQQIEKQVQADGKDETFTKMVEQENGLKKKMRARIEALTKSDPTLKTLSQQLKEVETKKDTHLKGTNEAYKAAAARVKAAADNKALAMAETKKKMAMKKEENAKKQAMKKEEIAKKQAMKKEEIAKKQAVKKAENERKKAIKKAEVEKKKKERAMKKGNG